MQISLDEQMVEYLKEKLKGDTWWCAEKILDSIKTGESFQEDRSKCKHKEGTYIGEKVCCTKCGGFKKGNFESWTLKK